MANQKKTHMPFMAIGLYGFAGILSVLFVMSIVGIFLEASSRAFFIMAALVILTMILASLLCANWFREKAKTEEKPKFASYAFEGEFAPKSRSKSKN